VRILALGAGIVTEVFHGYSHSLQANGGIVSYNRPRPLPSSTLLLDKLTDSMEQSPY
jgi:hypothetical protein